MAKLQIITRGMEENKGFYVNGLLCHDFQESEGTLELSSIFISFMNHYNITKIEQYHFSDEGVDRFCEDEHIFQQEFESYSKKEIASLS